MNSKPNAVNKYILLLLIIYIFFVGIIQIIFPSAASSAYISSILTFIVLFGFFLVLFFRKKTPLINIKPLKINTLVKIIVTTIVFYFFSSAVNGITLIFTKAGSQSLILKEHNFVLSFIIFAVMSAISEELFFRGIIYGAYKKAGVFSAVIISSLVFSAFHMNFNQLIYVFFSGVYFSLLYEATESILSSIIGHIILNGIGLFLSLFFTTNSDYTPVNLLYTLIIMFIAGFLTILFLKDLFKKEGKLITLKKINKTGFTKIISPVLIITFVILVALMILYQVI